MEDCRDQNKVHITFPVLILSSFSIAEFCAESHQVCMFNAIQECFNICAVLKVWLCNWVSSLAGSTGPWVAAVCATNFFARNFGCQGGGPTWPAYAFMQARSSAGPIRIAQDMSPTVLSIKHETHNNRLLLPPIVTLRLVTVVNIRLQLSSRVYPEMQYFVWIMTNLLSEGQQRSL